MTQKISALPDMSNLMLREWPDPKIKELVVASGWALRCIHPKISGTSKPRKAAIATRLSAALQAVLEAK